MSCLHIHLNIVNNILMSKIIGCISNHSELFLNHFLKYGGDIFKNAKAVYQQQRLITKLSTVNKYGFQNLIITQYLIIKQATYINIDIQYLTWTSKFIMILKIKLFEYSFQGKKKFHVFFNVTIIKNQGKPNRFWVQSICTLNCIYMYEHYNREACFHGIFKNVIT